MIRLRESCLTMTAIGFVFVLVGSSRPESHARLWEPSESHSGLLRSHQQGGSIRSTYPSTGLTLTRWAGSAFAPLVRPAVLRLGQVQGVFTSLVGCSGTASVMCPMGCGAEPCASIEMPSQSNAACSTGAYTYGSGDWCSVNAAPSSSQLSCSTTSLQAYCSTNVGTGGSAGPGTCSASGNATGTGKNSCSAANGSSSKCSTKANGENAGMTEYNCSAGVAGASTQSQCSTGGLSGTSGGVGYCSTTAGNIGGGTQNNNCSVSASGASGTSPNQCSTDGTQGSRCSTNGSQGDGITTDFCSVASSLSNAVCTVLNPGTGGGTCSASPGSANNCSVKSGTTVTGPGGNRLCQATGS